MNTYDNSLKKNLFPDERDVIVKFNLSNNEIINNKSNNQIIKRKLKKNNTPKNKKQTKPKINENDFQILSFDEYENIHIYNYNLTQLKTLCKNYKLKVSGNKERLKSRIYNYLKDSKNAIQIQKIIKGYFVRQYIKLHGPGLLNKKKCVNETDFYSLDELIEIPHYQFYSFKDNDEFIYGFDICSLYNYIKTQGENIVNPYNRKEFPASMITDIKKLITYCKIFKFPLELELEDLTETLSPNEKLNATIVTLFSSIDDLGFYTDPSWFINLERHHLIIFLREIVDIWNYRAQLTMEVKLSIYPFNNGNLFYGFHLNDLHLHSTYNIKKIAVEIINKFVNSSNDRSNRWMGASYCLSALTLVNNQTAQALPWLYQSVMY